MLWIAVDAAVVVVIITVIAVVVVVVFVAAVVNERQSPMRGTLLGVHDSYLLRHHTPSPSLSHFVLSPRPLSWANLTIFRLSRVIFIVNIFTASIKGLCDCCCSCWSCWVLMLLESGVRLTLKHRLQAQLRGYCSRLTASKA